VALSQRSAHRRGAIAVGVLIVAVAVSGVMRVTYGPLARSGTPVRVGLIQGNVDQGQKYDQAFRDAILGRYIDLSRRAIAAGAEVIIWPEAATPFFLDAERVLSEPIRRLAVQSRVPFLVGTDEFERSQDGAPPRYFNSAVLVGTDGLSRAPYRKMQLVPFGEYVPLKKLLFFVGPLIEAVSDFSAGTDPVVFDVDGRRVSVAICYESVYPWISRQFVQRGSQLLATITNDAWFGTSSAAPQHFEQGALRAIEQGRYVVRSANTGISGAVDPYGRTIATTPLFTPEAITVDVRLLDHRTIYSWIGDVVAWLSLAIAALVAVTGRWRRAA
jgi:apolipoprotein N-acyltransferase